MPLSKSKQVEYMRNYRKRNRYNVIPKTIKGVIPKSSINDLRNMVKRMEKGESRLHNENVQSIPFYNPLIHRAGDTVRTLKYGRWVTVTIPELDGEGQPIPEY